MGEFFEPQKARDCCIHSLNNSLGKVVVTKKQVVDFIEEKVRQYASDNSVPPDSEQVLQFKNTLMTNNTFFTAQVVWDTAKALGTIGGVTPIPGFGGNFDHVDTLPTWVREKTPLVILGIDEYGSSHAIAVRRGKIYDSQLHSRGPRRFTDEELHKSLKKVFAAFAVYGPRDPPIRVVRTRPSRA